MKNNLGYSQSKLGKFATGGILILIGLIFLLKQFGYFFPDWLFSWPMILIVTGLFIGAKHQYRYDVGWLILTGIGVIFLLQRINPAIHLLKYLWPVIIIGVGLWIVLGNHTGWRQSRKRNRNRGYIHSDPDMNPDINCEAYPGLNSSEDQMDDVVVFGAIKKNILSKNFRGGEIVNIFGGTELNLVNADFSQRAELEITQIFGGIKLIIPSNWEVVSEVVTIFGGTDDKRRQINPVFDKKLFITGTSIFGGIEIHTYA